MATKEEKKPELVPIAGAEDPDAKDAAAAKKEAPPIFPRWVYNVEGDSKIVNSQEELDKANEDGDWRDSPADFSDAERAAAAAAAEHPLAAAKVKAGAGPEPKMATKNGPDRR